MACWTRLLASPRPPRVPVVREVNNKLWQDVAAVVSGTRAELLEAPTLAEQTRLAREAYFERSTRFGRQFFPELCLTTFMTKYQGLPVSEIDFLKGPDVPALPSWCSTATVRFNRIDDDQREFGGKGMSPLQAAIRRLEARPTSAVSLATNHVRCRSYAFFDTPDAPGQYAFSLIAKDWRWSNSLLNGEQEMAKSDLRRAFLGQKQLVQRQEWETYMAKRPILGMLRIVATLPAYDGLMAGVSVSGNDVIVVINRYNADVLLGDLVDDEMRESPKPSERERPVITEEIEQSWRRIIELHNKLKKSPGKRTV